jgi:hypothetical protein
MGNNSRPSARKEVEQKSIRKRSNSRSWELLEYLEGPSLDEMG